MGEVVQLNISEAIAKVGDSTGCLELCLRNEQIDQVTTNSMLMVQNCNVRVQKKKMILEIDGFSTVNTLEKFGNTVFPPDQLKQLINLE